MVESEQLSGKKNAPFMKIHYLYLILFIPRLNDYPKDNSGSLGNMLDNEMKY